MSIMMNFSEVPMQKKAFLNRRFTLAIDEELQKELMALKYQEGIDVSEWIRQLVRTNIPILKKLCERSS